jgi:hypothetical protein
MMVEIEPKKVKRSRRRMLSPPTLPPRWGEGVAPPPTPHFTPHVSPEASTEDHLFVRVPHRSRRRPRIHHEAPILHSG